LFCLQENNGDASRKKGSGRPRSARTEENIGMVGYLTQSPPHIPQTHLSQRETARGTGILQRSVGRIIKKDLQMTPKKKVKVHFLSPNNQQQRVLRCEAFLSGQFQLNFSVHFLVASDEKMFSLQGFLFSFSFRILC
jgi:predicted XRE-type DNA-binding protein